MANQIQNDYLSPSNASIFFIAYPEENHLNAQDVAFELVSGSKNISIATFQYFKNDDDLISDEKIIELQTQLEMIEQVLPLVFESGED
ncbi:hypothetical protein C3420_13845 [Acinetobacter sp. ACNIH3]|uniref:hypothetical protein n=1 Tax=unclassified Acinetobacter TaxID=196816 RepID=UPI000CDE1D14|nr:MULTISPECIES: hypothetical protein [unclassified Acinetobacter]POU19366.1 hypothetical protein C3420_13845 [Acinetobacter sp. ACNIH3]POV73529.1 hypothetical protein C3421_16120 [Acinetobacter sp. ACNIH4]